MTKSSIYICALILALSGSGRLSGDEEQRSELLRKASVVLEGQVIGVGTALPGIPESPTTIIVRVKKVIIEAPVVKIKTGSQLTIAAKEPLPQLGELSRFYAAGWILGSTIALRELGRERLAVSSAANTDEAQEIASMRGRQIIDDLRRQVEAVDFACAGRVTQIAPEIGNEGGAPPVSEHDTGWQIATVQIASCLKGTFEKPRVQILFPSSHDVQFKSFRRPVLGSDGFFLIRRLDPEGGLGSRREVDGELVDMLSREAARQVSVLFQK